MVAIKKRREARGGGGFHPAHDFGKNSMERNEPAQGLVRVIGAGHAAECHDGKHGLISSGGTRCEEAERLLMCRTGVVRDGVDVGNDREEVHQPGEPIVVVAIAKIRAERGREHAEKEREQHVRRRSA